MNHPSRCPVAHVPRLASEWKLLFQPEKSGNYINDHCIIRATDDNWHLFGITAPPETPGPEYERYFAHGTTHTLWSDLPMHEHGAVCNDGTRAWAPCIVPKGNQYFMYYGPSPTKMAVSRDCGHWIGAPVSILGAPPESCHRDHMVIALDENTWLMYATGLDAVGKGAISVFVSNNLTEWRFVRFALTTCGKKALTPSWGATESPFVFRYGGWYYLSMTYTDCHIDNYHNTLIFRSLNPFDFGVYNADAPDESVVARLHAHAPEYLYDEATQQWYITTCGWRNFQIPHEGGVSIAKFDWQLA